MAHYDAAKKPEQIKSVAQRIIGYAHFSTEHWNSTGALELAMRNLTARCAPAGTDYLANSL
jgi:hypothetical protein